MRLDTLYTAIRQYVAPKIKFEERRKVLGYILAQRTAMSESASELFRSRLTDDRLKNRLELVNRAIPCTAVVFDIATDRAVCVGRENVSEPCIARLRTGGSYSKI